jgi:CheY-like chemotaxis protein
VPPLPARSFRLLLVESNPADAYLSLEGLKLAGLSQGVTVVDDSAKAWEHLQLEGPSPDLVLLDLNIAPISGLELLGRIRANAKLANVPVVIMSGSENKEDVRRAYRSGANSYINKPARLDEFNRFMKTCYEYWGTVATLPPR